MNLLRMFTTLLLACFSFLNAPASVIQDPENLKSSYEQDFNQRFYQTFRKMDSKSIVGNLVALSIEGDRSDYEKYLLKRAIINEYRFIGDSEAALSQCQSISIKADDYEIAAACIDSSQISLPEKRSALESILKNAIRNKGNTVVPAQVAEKLLSVIWMQNDFAGARIVYKAVVDRTPKTASNSLIGLKEVVALLYSNPSNSIKVIGEGARLYNELEEQYKADPSGQWDAQRIAYNKGIMKLMSLEDYEGAIEEFRKLGLASRNWVDSRVFIALSSAHLGRAQEAREALHGIQLDQYTDPLRRAFLECYRSIAIFEINDSTELDTCVQLPRGTQTEVVFHITKYLSKIRIGKDVELKLWRQFWLLYQENLAPQMQAQVERQVNEVELIQARVENEIKDLELKNFQLVKILLVVALLALGSIFGLFIRLRSRNHKIEKLQTYIHKSVLSRFLPPLLVDEIIQGQSRIESKPKQESITVLFADLVGFTEIAGRLGAEATAHILNQFMEVVSEVIHQHGGTIDKFIGDAVMVIFGAPLPLSEHIQAEKATRCAESILTAIEALNPSFEKDYSIKVHVRIGINQGSAIVGTFGSERRSDYTAIGPTVNLASRIEGAAKPNEILVSTEVARMLSEEILDPQGLYELKGIDQPVRLFAIKRNVAEVVIQ